MGYTLCESICGEFLLVRQKLDRGSGGTHKIYALSLIREIVTATSERENETLAL